MDAPPHCGTVAGLDFLGGVTPWHTVSAERGCAYCAKPEGCGENNAVYVDRSYGLEVRWERDLAVPTANDLPRIAEVLAVDVDALFVEVMVGTVAGGPIADAEAMVNV